MKKRSYPTRTTPFIQRNYIIANLLILKEHRIVYRIDGNGFVFINRTAQ
jgi:hypothetical protein